MPAPTTDHPRPLPVLFHPAVVSAADHPSLLVDTFTGFAGSNEHIVCDLHLLVGHGPTGLPIYEQALAASVPVTAKDLSARRRQAWLTSVLLRALDDAIDEPRAGSRLQWYTRAIEAVLAGRVTIHGPLAAKG